MNMFGSMKLLLELNIILSLNLLIKDRKFCLFLFMKPYIEEENMSYIADYTNTYDIRGHEIEITAPARFDDRTHEVIPDLELDDQAVKLALEKFRKIYDVVSPEQMKALRKKFAKVLGWSSSTVALYEAGAVPTNGNNRLLKILIKDDKVMKEFIEDSQKSEL